MIVEPPDLELWLTRWLRGRLQESGHQVEVSNKEPVDWSARRPLVVLRCDGGPAVPPCQWDWRVGVNVLAGTARRDLEAMGLARLVAGVMTDVPAVLTAEGSPVTDVTGPDGPYRVDDPRDVTRVYLTVGYRVIGSW
jgi:hypothetical protein